MTEVTLVIRMEGEAQAVKELAAMELEKLLRRIGRVEVRCTGAREVRPEQLRMIDAPRGA